jgi:hypothetical protein
MMNYVSILDDLPLGTHGGPSDAFEFGDAVRITQAHLRDYTSVLLSNRAGDYCLPLDVRHSKHHGITRGFSNRLEDPQL